MTVALNVFFITFMKQLTVGSCRKHGETHRVNAKCDTFKAHNID